MALLPLLAGPVLMAKLIFGCGYLGLRVARLWRDAGHSVYAVTRTQHRAAQVAAAGVKPLIGDLMAAQQITLPQGIDTALFCVGYDRTSGHSMHEVYFGGLARAIVCDPALAEDVAQEAFLRAWRHAPAYDARKGTVTTWLLTITRNLAVDAVRMRRSQPVDPDVLSSLNLAATGPDGSPATTAETHR